MTTTSADSLPGLRASLTDGEAGSTAVSMVTSSGAPARTAGADKYRLVLYDRLFLYDDDGAVSGAMDITWTPGTSTEGQSVLGVRAGSGSKLPPSGACIGGHTWGDEYNYVVTYVSLEAMLLEPAPAEPEPLGGKLAMTRRLVEAPGPNPLLGDLLDSP